MSKKKLGSFNDLINAYFQSFIFICLPRYERFLASKFLWHCWIELGRSWKHLRKSLRSHEKLQSLTNLSGTNIGIHSNSRDWLFLMFMLSKIKPLMNKSMLFWKDVQTAFSIFIKNSRNAIPKYHLYNSSISIEYIYLYQNCTDIVALILSNVMRNIINEIDKTFVRTK